MKAHSPRTGSNGTHHIAMTKNHFAMRHLTPSEYR